MNNNPIPRPLKVFICHSKLDGPAAQELYYFLNDREASPWLDSRSLIGGQDWRQEISQEINKSDAIVICLSRNSLNKEGFIQLEIKYALEKAKQVPRGNIFIIPVKLEECEVPMELQEYHWVNLFEPDGHERLLKSLQTRAKQLAGITVPRVDPMPKAEKEAQSVQKKEQAPGGASTLKEKTPSKPLPKKIAPPKPRRFFIVWVLLFLAAAVSIAVAFLSRGETPAPPTELVTEPAVEFQTEGARLSPSTDSDDGMTLIHIPSGSFTMGDDDTEGASPAHVVTLPGFRIDGHEVTNAQYSLCVNAGDCQVPSLVRSSTRQSYYNNPRFVDYPVIYVSWVDARNYCEWAGRRLPTEAEWEKAARGADAYVYPWGSDLPGENFLNFNNESGDTQRIVFKALSNSPYGVSDMSGNVAEWVDGFYVPYNSDAGSAGDLRILRGGSWVSPLEDVRAFVRVAVPASSRDDKTGFRCAVDE